MNKDELLAVIGAERVKLETLINGVGADRMEAAGVSGQYSTKDVIAHLTAYQRALVTWLREARAGRTYVDRILDQPDLDVRNEAAHEASKGQSVRETIQSFRQTMDDLEQHIAPLTDEELNDADAAAWFVEPRWHRKEPLWQCIANDSYEHQQEHIPDLERWLLEHPR